MLVKLQHLQDLPEYKTVQPFELYGYPTPNSPPHSNFVHERCEVDLIDARGRECQYNINTQGFIWLKHPSKCKLLAEHFESAEHGNDVVEAYLAEVIELVQQQMGVKQVCVMDWRFRRNQPENLDVKPLRSRARPPGATIHCDYSYDGGMDRLQMHLLPHELDLVKQGNLTPVFINVWRPMFTVDNSPLVLCDRRSVLKEDLMEIDKVLADRVEKGYFLLHRKYHIWHTLSSQQADEVAIFKSWSGESNGRFAAYPPHGAVPESPQDRKPRESVEVRLIVMLPGAG